MTSKFLIYRVKLEWKKALDVFYSMTLSLLENFIWIGSLKKNVLKLVKVSTSKEGLFRDPLSFDGNTFLIWLREEKQKGEIAKNVEYGACANLA